MKYTDDKGKEYEAKPGVYQVFRDLAPSGATRGYQIVWHDHAGRHVHKVATANEAEAWMAEHPLTTSVP